MYLTEYLSIFNQNINILNEYGVPNQPPQNPGNSNDPEDGTVEFEIIKKYLLYNKLKELKAKLLKTKLNRTNANVQSIYDFINLVLEFFNIFSYTDCKRLLDRITDMIIAVNKLQVPVNRLQLGPEMDAKKIQAQQAQAQAQQAQDQEQQKHQADADYMADMQKQNARLDLLLKKMQLKSLRKQGKIDDIERLKQTDLNDHMNRLQKRNAELDLMGKRLQLGMQLNDASKQLRSPKVIDGDDDSKSKSKSINNE